MRETDKLKEVNEFRAKVRLQPIQIKQRECLKCDTKFSSSSAGNRICPRCTSLNHEFADYATQGTSYEYYNKR